MEDNQLNFGAIEPLSNQEIQEASQLKKTSNKTEEPLLQTRISSGSRCGFAQSGNVMYLINNSKSSFRVVINVHYRHDRGEQGNYNKTVVISSLSKISLGCSNSGGPVGSVTRYTFQIKSETKL